MDLINCFIKEKEKRYHLPVLELLPGLPQQHMHADHKNSEEGSS